MPNQPHATTARRIAGTFAPRTPKAERASTGNGMPYLVPACELSTIGMSTTKLPTITDRTAACHDHPRSTRLDASVYVGMQIAMPIQSDAMCHQFHVRRCGSTGARSGLVRRMSYRGALRSAVGYVIHSGLSDILGNFRSLASLGTSQTSAKALS